MAGKSISAALRQLLQSKGPSKVGERLSREEQTAGAARADAARSRPEVARSSFGNNSKRPGANKTFEN